jgi:hypothetical protein
MLPNDPVEFMTKAKFSKLIDSVVIGKRLSYMDAVLHLCEEYQIDPSDVKRYISSVVKTKIEAEAISLNFLEGGNELPI